MEIDWNSFGLVFAASIGFSTVIVATFAFGVRLYTNALSYVSAAKKGNRSAAVSEVLNRAVAYSMFAIASGALLYGIYLIVPIFHLDK
ncbi:MAG: hypothetical protein RLZZ587_331 [Actinomycetota bacterium]|jgi:hypothetical protein